MTYLLDNLKKIELLEKHNITFVCSLNSVFVHWEQQGMVNITNVCDETFYNFLLNT